MFFTATFLSCFSSFSGGTSPALQKLKVWTFSISTSLPFLPAPDILLTHNCGSPPPIAGINPHLRPPRHTVCSPTMHLSSKLSQTHLAFSLSLLLLPPSSAPFLSLGLPTALHRPVSCAVCLFFPKLSKFPPFSFSPFSNRLTNVSPNLPQSPFDIKWRRSKTTNAGCPAVITVVCRVFAFTFSLWGQICFLLSGQQSWRAVMSQRENVKDPQVVGKGPVVTFLKSHNFFFCFLVRHKVDQLKSLIGVFSFQIFHEWLPRPTIVDSLELRIYYLRTPFTQKTSPLSPAKTLHRPWTDKYGTKFIGCKLKKLPLQLKIQIK